MQREIEVSWEPPAPRAGIAGAWDRFVGPGTTDAEQWVQLAGVVAVSSSVVLHWWATWENLEWSWVQLFVSSLLLLDVAGGIVTNATSPAKRWYHRAGYSRRQHMTFIGLHLAHLLLLMVLFDEYGLGFVLVNYGFLVGAVLFLLAVPLYMQRPWGFTLYSLAVVGSIYLYKGAPGLEWFLPLFYLKLLLSHGLTEAPFRPVEIRGQRAGA